MRFALALAIATVGCTQASSIPAASKYPDMQTLWNTSITRTCSPNNGVCHNDRQFPDMQTSAGLLATVNARCNQLRDDPTTIDDLCEPFGDLFQMGGFSSRIGSVTATPASGTPVSLTITLHDPVPPDATGPASIVRQLPGLAPDTLPIPSTASASIAGAQSVTLLWAPMTDPILAAAPGGVLATFLLPPRPVAGDATQVQLGDPNGDGIFGADLDGALVKPGRPLDSYLFLRVLGPRAGQPQMPIANMQHWDEQDGVTALGCWITGMKADGSNAEEPIDYGQCKPASWLTPPSTP